MSYSHFTLQNDLYSDMHGLTMSRATTPMILTPPAEWPSPSFSLSFCKRNMTMKHRTTNRRPTYHLRDRNRGRSLQVLRCFTTSSCTQYRRGSAGNPSRIRSTASWLMDEDHAAAQERFFWDQLREKDATAKRLCTDRELKR